MRDYRTPTARVRGLGSAHEGTGHWINQRVSAVAMVPLVLWFVGSIIFHLGDDRAAIMAWLQNPLVAILLTLGLVASFYHARLGIQVVVEDYIHNTAAKVVSLLVVQLLLLALGVGSVFAVWKMALA
ncbi:MAG: succinate dehydrogenase, hydrophobic membrane anchor protein [SAR116 cluster bacterium]|jgi:succinate dehydrogenase, hydrophobic membrane anchor protein|nr:succinate dehydrogenase, hydrophobic membrane anchor protein [Paracoccaceae bacterium]RCL81024.1 MAG: succinate dehydrogenase, hydrophobic membrane anchor protein [SAR116 cluster bacterium]HCJ62548.1 succinate dehydrogenase, hydrophobic membrane anchor protein [Alphaproteobacteria bacterium]|tara:strand:+ start:265 stop:645 length:381 start_codon:yes stop_codon:yes gene_type:complete